jgi:hypothetical protein
MLDLQTVRPCAAAASCTPAASQVRSAELDDVRQFVRQQVDETLKPRQIDMPARGQLVKEGTEGRPDPQCPFEKPGQRLAPMNEPAHLRDIAIGLDQG